MSETPITLDFTYLHSLTGGDKSFEQILLTGTLADVDTKIGNLKGSLEGADAAGIRTNAHSLVSLSAIAGMPEVVGWARTIDQSFADGIFHPEHIPLINKIIMGWPAAKSQLEKMIAAY